MCQPRHRKIEKMNQIYVRGGVYRDETWGCNRAHLQVLCCVTFPERAPARKRRARCPCGRGLYLVDFLFHVLIVHKIEQNLEKVKGFPSVGLCDIAFQTTLNK